MAWLGLTLGTLVGLGSSILACIYWDLPLWAALLLHPVIGTAIAVSVILLLLLRNETETRGDKIRDTEPVAS
ncbi:hypothetical protein [Ruegeria marina]|uniref:Uncharacterized protein n=1 Tax=Ruegeria marina TaxID=639004 RepID=A0A1G6LY15_9RHOB|nr:hypothetical protein [Ruegeria marina]SDC47596.1 hypothetical protein SAMN04488239_102345 [Ruegeria marina]